MSSPTQDPGTPLPTTLQTVILAVMGIVVWFLVTLLLRALAPVGALEGTGVAVTYALLIPGTWPLILAIRGLAGMRRDQTLLAVAMVTGVASLCDGTALVVWPSLYGTNPFGAAAAILWGVGVALVMGVAMNRR